MAHLQIYFVGASWSTVTVLELLWWSLHGNSFWSTSKATAYEPREGHSHIQSKLCKALKAPLFNSLLIQNP